MVFCEKKWYTENSIVHKEGTVFRKCYTSEQKQEWVQAYREGKSVAAICAGGGPSKNSLYKWIKEYNGFITENGTEISGHRLVTLEQQNRHLTELLNISKVCPCNANSPREEKLRAVEKLEGQFSLHAICDYLSLPRGTYYNSDYRLNSAKLS